MENGGIRHAKEAADAECRGWIKEANRGTCAMHDNALQRVWSGGGVLLLFYIFIVAV